MMSLEDKTILQEQIVDEMFARILTNQPKNEAFFTSYLFKKLEEIFKIEVNYLGLKYTKSTTRKNDVSFEIQPKKNETTLGAFTFTGGVPKVIIYSFHNNYYNIMSDNPEIRIKALKSFLKTLFHELKHLKQYLLTQEGISNKNVLRNAKEFLVVQSKSKNFIKLYKDNHDEFAIEADAILKAYNKFNRLTNNTYLVEDDIYSLIINEANRDYNDVVYDNKVYNRDSFISFAIDYNINNVSNHDYFKLMPILLKEYNPDGSKKSISDLIYNMKSDLKDAELIENEYDKNQTINDINEFYYELIYNKLTNKDSFELYEATNNYSQEEVNDIIDKIKDYYGFEKKRTLKLLKDKFTAESLKNSNNENAQFIKYNNGKIKVDTLNNTELVSTDDYAKKLSNKTNNPNIDLLYKSKAFKFSIPDNGIYLLKNNTKISVETFAEKIFIKEFEELRSKSNIGLKYRKILSQYVKSPLETEFIFKCEKVNQLSQVKSNLLDEVQRLPVLSKKKIDIDSSIFDTMRLIKEIDNPNVINSIRNYMLSNIELSDDDYYYTFNYDQISYFDMLQTVAKLLNSNPTLNPYKKDYYNNFKKNIIIEEISSELKRYYKILNSDKNIKKR